MSGVLETETPFWEDRMVRPVDVYPRYRNEPYSDGGVQSDERSFRVTQNFVEIETEDGLIGRAGPVWDIASRIVLEQIQPLLLGEDPLATEYLWDLVHRALVHGRQGDAMIALSAVDCALWDLKGKAFDVPCWKLAGGATRQSIPAYASMLGFSVSDLDLVRDRANEMKSQGFQGQKWFFRHGPESGAEGLKANVALVRTLRETVGDDVMLMFDCWQSMTYPYALELCRRIEEFHPYWIEEVFLPDRIDNFVKLKPKTSIPLSGAEHGYTRWGMRQYIDKGALDILQPDPYWCGGFSETLKIAALAELHDLTLIPHGHSTGVNAHISAAISPAVTPMAEHLTKWSQVNRFFFREQLEIIEGSVTIPTGTGLGIELDPGRAEKDEYL